MSIRHISWNVNGIRSVMRKVDLARLLDQYRPTVFCLQEVKSEQDQAALEVNGYQVFWNSAKKRGYSGTAILTSVSPEESVLGTEDLGNDEGRVITLEFAHYYLVTVYTPNTKRDLSRLPYRHKTWDPQFLLYLRSLERKKPVVFCGDLNAAHTEIDLANPKSNKMNAGFTAEERRGIDNLVSAGFVDTFRLLEQNGGHYTWWTYRNNARERNIGWRIDYFFVSQSLAKSVKSARILGDVLGSDHCPVLLDLDL